MLNANKAAAFHTHDDRYYTEAEINSKLKLKEIWCNITPSELGVTYTYRNNDLINRPFIIANFTSTCGSIFVPAGKFSILNFFTQENQQFWGGEIHAEYNSETGTITFKVVWMGTSQSLSNFLLYSVCYI